MMGIQTAAFDVLFFNRFFNSLAKRDKFFNNFILPQLSLLGFGQSKISVVFPTISAAVFSCYLRNSCLEILWDKYKNSRGEAAQIFLHSDKGLSDLQ